MRWYMISNAPPWDNLKFDLEGVEEVQRKFFGTLYNTYSFFSLYAGLDQYVYNPERAIPIAERPELDRWVVSKCNSLMLTVTQAFDDYDPTRAARAIEDFTSEQLSNWYVRLSRRRFWKGDIQADKQAAYDTLFECLSVITQLMAPVSPFFSDWLYRSLRAPANEGNSKSVHLSNFPVSQPVHIDNELEETMQVAQDLCSMVLSLRKKEKLRVRQPLSREMVPVANEQFRQRLQHVESLILSEVNVKELHYLEEDNEVLVKKLRLNFKALGPRAGARMKVIQEKAQHLTQADIRKLEQDGKIALQMTDGEFELMLEETEILAQDIPGWQVAVNGNLTVALDITLDDALISEGRARDLVNRIQNMRKDQGFQVTDRIRIEWQADEAFAAVIAAHADYICAEVLAEELSQCKDPALDFFDIDGLRVGLRLALAPSPATN